jgi:hypothetical protein
MTQTFADFLTRRAYVLGSLKNVEEAGQVTGFEFSFYCLQWRLFFYATQGLEISLGGRALEGAPVTIHWNGLSSPAEQLAENDFAVCRGETVTVSVGYPGGLVLDELHEIAIRQLSSGGFGSDIAEGRGDRWTTLALVNDRVAPDNRSI